MPNEAAPLAFTYRNWRGEIGHRSVYPIRMEWGSTEWHPEPQWLLVAHDIEKGAERSFAVKDIIPDEHPAFQARVQPWMMECFGPLIAGDREERNHRFLEEALELVQACGCTASEAHQIVDYVYGRPIGEPHQEVGGVMVTLAALCLANGMDMHSAGETELDRIWTKVAAIRAKQAAKPKHSPLPGPSSLTCQCANTITDPCIVCGKGKTLVTAEWVQKMAAREGDLDPTTGTGGTAKAGGGDAR